MYSSVDHAQFHNLIIYIQTLIVNRTSKCIFIYTLNPNLQSRLEQSKAATLGGGDLLLAVRLPEGTEKNEWLALNAVYFFNELCLIMGPIRRLCTCLKMSAGTHDYLWQDDARFVTPTAMSASEYVDQLLVWAELQINDESIFPLLYGNRYPRNFEKRVSAILRRFFRVYAHIYTNHYDDMNDINCVEHLNTCFKFLLYFITEHKLIDTAEFKPIENIIAKFNMPEDISRK